MNSSPLISSAVPGWPFRTWAQAHQFWLSCWCDPQATEDVAASYRTRQFKAVAAMLPLAGFATFFLVVVLVGLALGRNSGSFFLVVLVLLCTFGALDFLLYAYARRMRVADVVSVSTIRGLAFFLGFAGLLYASLLVQMYGLLDEHGRLYATVVATAFIATGSWMFSGHPLPGLFWIFGICGGLALQLWLFYWPEYDLLGYLSMLYGGFLVAVVLLTSRRFLHSMMVETEVANQRQLAAVLLQDFEENASEWLWEVDRQGSLRYVSARFCSAARASADNLVGRTFTNVLRELVQFPTEEDLHWIDVLCSHLDKSLAFQRATVTVRVDGHTSWWSLSAKPLKDTAGRVLGWRGVGTDITAVRQRDLELIRLATHDSLTGLANRHFFGVQLEQHFSRYAEHVPCTVMLLDLDNFKTVNDSLGHAAGDALLCEVARRFKKCVGGYGVVARLGGDEFGIILPAQWDRVAIEELGRNLREVLVQPWSHGDHVISIHSSIGVACAPADADTSAALLKAADMALYAAKAAGRDVLRFFNVEMDLLVRKRLQLLSDMRTSLQQGHFEVHYQPQVNLTDGVLAGFEALVRWRHPVRGMVSPTEFVPLAEESGLIVPLGAWVLNQACNDAQHWPASLRLAVNVAATQFERSTLIDVVSDALEHSGLPPHRLELELTESTLLRNGETVTDVLRALRSIQVRIALDDFGTGFSSLSYLRTFPLDKLKIDRSFVCTLDKGTPQGCQSSAAIVRAIVELAKALQLETTAEGIETQAQNDILRDIGCTYGQGYLLARPMDAATTLGFITRCGMALPTGSVSRSVEPQSIFAPLIERRSGPRIVMHSGFNP